MKRIIAIIAISIIAIGTWAVPAKPTVIKHVQSNGEEIEYRLRGDEFLKYRTTTDNYLIKQNNDGDYEYAEMVGGRVKSTGVRVSAVRGEIENALLARIGRVNMQASKMNALRAANKVTRARAPRDANAAPRGLVILVNFSNLSFESSTANADFDNLLNQTNYSANGATGSANDYFKSVSDGAYDPDFDVYGPYTLDNNMSYYGANDYTDNDALPAQMVLDAMNKLMSDNSVNINLNNYDSDNDGILNDIFVFYAGHNEAEGASAETIWPHAWEVGDYNTTGNRVFKGKTLQGYACTSELRGVTGSTMSGIGTFCHEFSHVLGLPDIYATDYSEHKTSGYWDIMDYGSYLNDGNTPPSYSAYERFFMGWMTPTILNKGGQYTLNNISDSNTAYLISATGQHNLDGENPNPAEYFLLENRKLSGWDAFLPGPGMIITRIRYKDYLWEGNEVNNSDWYMGIDIIEADGDAPDANYYNPSNGYYGKAGDAFPGSDNKRYYTPYDDYPITNIQLSNDTISFDFMGGKALYTVDFTVNTAFGTCATESLKESEEGSGIELPTVSTVADSIDFEGWATERTATEANAGEAGDMYYPNSNITLYALFSVDGEIVDDVLPGGDCLVESFDGLTGLASSSDISTKIGDLADNEGWTGVKLFPYNTTVKVGSNKHKGSLTTPQLGFSGEVEISIRAMAKSSATLKISTTDGTERSLKLTDAMADYTISIEGLSKESTITFETGSTIFYIDNIEICGDVNGGSETDTDISQTIEAMIVGTRKLVGISEGDIIRCYDSTGRMHWETISNSNTMDIDAPTGVYLIRIERDGEVEILKGINR